MDDRDDSEKRERVLLRPWLENLIESGSIPGLEWMDDGKTMFKVPWKHRSKKSWSLKHSSIFLEWAKNTGRWSEGDPEPNYAQLKTRLRCAFNKAPDIEEMRELHRTKAEEPFKVYKFIPRKESKLYPFSRRPLRKTTVPITVRKRRYFISHMASTYSGVSSGHRAVLSDSSSVRIKEEKEDVSDSSFKEMVTEENFNDIAINQNWKNWLPDHNQRLNGGRGACQPFYGTETKDHLNRILPLIVEEANSNSVDLELQIPKDREVESKSSSSILPEIIKDQIDPVPNYVNAPFIGIPKSLEEDLMDKERTRNKELFSSSSLTSKELECLHNWNCDSSALYASSRFAVHPLDKSIFPGGVPSILPQVNGKISHSDSVIPDSNSGVPPSWSQMASSESCDHFIREKRPSLLAQEPEMAGRRNANSVPSARLLPLKKLYVASQNTSDLEQSSIDVFSIIQDKLVNATVGPNVFAQPRVAVAFPYDDRSTRETEMPFPAESVLNDLNKGVVGNDADLPELEVIDLSAKFSANETQNSESRVLDLTKKMVVTPFEHNCSMWRNVTKSGLPDVETDIYEDSVLNDPVTTMNELLKFKLEYKRKKQLIMTKTVLLLEKEKELKARGKQLAAREEALFWKETYLHRVLSGLSYSGLIPSSTSGSVTTIAPSVESLRGPAGLTGFPELKGSCPENPSPPTLTLFTPPHGSALMPEGASGGFQQPLSAVPLFRPGHLNNIPGFQIHSENAKDRFLLSPGTSVSFSANPRRVPVVATRHVSYGDPEVTPKTSLLPSGDKMMYNGNADLHFEPESNVALGDACPTRKFCPLPMEKFQSEATSLSLAASSETPMQPLQMARKRGRPKGSKNKAKPIAAINATPPVMRQMPPLLVIQSPGMKDAVTSALKTEPSLPFHVMRNEIVSSVMMDHLEDVVEPTAAYSDGSRQTDIHCYKSREAADRILPPVSTDTDCSSSCTTASGKTKPNCLTSEPDVSNPLPVMRSSPFDHLPIKDVMPETIRH